MSDLAGRGSKQSPITNGCVCNLVDGGLIVGQEFTIGRYISNVSRKALIPFKSIFPPSGSTASMHRAIAIICFGSFALTQIRPFIPTAASSGNLPPSKGKRK